MNNRGRFENVTGLYKNFQEQSITTQPTSPDEIETIAPLQQQIHPDLTIEIIETAGYQLRLIVMANRLEYVDSQQTIARGSLTLGALDPLPQEKFIYNRIRQTLQGFLINAAFGGLLMVDTVGMFTGIEISPLFNRMSAPPVFAVIDLKYVSSKPRIKIQFKQNNDGIWQEVNDER